MTTSKAHTLFYKTLLKHPVYYDKAINEKKSSLLQLLKTPSQYFINHFDTSLVIRTIDHFGVNEFIKKVFTSVNVSPQGLYRYKVFMEFYRA